MPIVIQNQPDAGVLAQANAAAGAGIARRQNMLHAMQLGYQYQALGQHAALAQQQMDQQTQAHQDNLMMAAQERANQHAYQQAHLDLSKDQLKQQGDRHAESILAEKEARIAGQKNALALQNNHADLSWQQSTADNLDKAFAQRHKAFSQQKLSPIGTKELGNLSGRYYDLQKIRPTLEPEEYQEKLANIVADFDNKGLDEHVIKPVPTQDAWKQDSVEISPGHFVVPKMDAHGNRSWDHIDIADPAKKVEPWQRPVHEYLADPKNYDHEWENAAKRLIDERERKAKASMSATDKAMKSEPVITRPSPGEIRDEMNRHITERSVHQAALTPKSDTVSQSQAPAPPAPGPVAGDVPQPVPQPQPDGIIHDGSYAYIPAGHPILQQLQQAGVKVPSPAGGMVTLPVSSLEKAKQQLTKGGPHVRSTELPRPESKDDVEMMPSGTSFIAPNGMRKIKP